MTLKMVIISFTIYIECWLKLETSIIVLLFYPQTLASSLESKCYFPGNLVVMKLPLTTSAKVSSSTPGHG